MSKFNVLIAGSTGYIGIELVHQLELNNFPYTGIDKKPSSNNNCLNFNLSDKEQVIDIISMEKPDYFFHLATHSALAYKNDFLNVFHEDTSALHNILSGLKKSNNTMILYSPFIRGMGLNIFFISRNRFKFKTKLSDVFKNCFSISFAFIKGTTGIIN